MVGAVGLEPTCTFRSCSQSRRSTFDPHSERPQGFASGQPARSTMTVEVDPTWLIGFGCEYRDRTGLFERMKLVRTPCLPLAINQLQYNFQRIESLASLQLMVPVTNLIHSRSWSTPLIHFCTLRMLLSIGSLPLRYPEHLGCSVTPCGRVVSFIYHQSDNHIAIVFFHQQLTYLFPSSITAIARDSGHHTLRNTLLLRIQQLFRQILPQTRPMPEGGSYTEVDLARTTGLEPVSSGVTGQYSNQLNYIPKP